MKLPMSEAEKQEIRTAAEIVGQKPVTWSRDQLLKQARQIIRKRGEGGN